MYPPQSLYVGKTTYYRVLPALNEDVIGDGQVRAGKFLHVTLLVVHTPETWCGLWGGSKQAIPTPFRGDSGQSDHRARNGFNRSHEFIGNVF
jgi:hypothetical protein